VYAYATGSPVLMVDSLGGTVGSVIRTPQSQQQGIEFWRHFWNLLWEPAPGRDYLGCLARCIEDCPLFPGWSYPSWPRRKPPGMKKIDIQSDYTTWWSKLRLKLPKGHWARKPLRWLSKASPWITIADGAFSWAKIAKCSYQCAR